MAPLTPHLLGHGGWCRTRSCAVALHVTHGKTRQNGLAHTNIGQTQPRSCLARRTSYVNIFLGVHQPLWYHTRTPGFSIFTIIRPLRCGVARHLPFMSRLRATMAPIVGYSISQNQPPSSMLVGLQACMHNPDVAWSDVRERCSHCGLPQSSTVTTMGYTIIAL